MYFLQQEQFGYGFQEKHSMTIITKSSKREVVFICFQIVLVPGLWKRTAPWVSMPLHGITETGYGEFV